MLPDCAAQHLQWRRLFEDVGGGGSGRQDAVAFILDELDSIDSRARVAPA